MSELGGAEVGAPESGRDSSEAADGSADRERPAGSETATEAPRAEPGEAGPAEPAAEVPANQDGKHTETSGKTREAAPSEAPEPGENGPAEQETTRSPQEETAADPVAEAEVAEAGSEVAEAGSAAEVEQQAEADRASAEPHQPEEPGESGENGPAEASADERSTETGGSEEPGTREPVADAEPQTEPQTETEPEPETAREAVDDGAADGKQTAEPRAEEPAEVAEPIEDGEPEPTAARIESADAEPAEEPPGGIADEPEVSTGEALEKPDADVTVEDAPAESGDERTDEGPDPGPARGESPADMERDDAKSTDAELADGETQADRRSLDELSLAAGGPGSGGASDASQERVRQLKEAEKEARKICRDHGARNVKVDYSREPIDPVCARDINKSIDALATDYPSAFGGLKKVQTYGKTGRADQEAATAYSRPFSWDSQHGIYLNAAKFADKGIADATQQRNEQNGNWVPAGSRTMDHVMYHEFGHVLGQKLFDSPTAHAELDQAVAQVIGRPYHSTNPARGHFSQTADAIKGQLSKYGSTTPHEMVAEAFAEYKLSSNPRPLASAVGSLIDRHLKGK